MITADQILAHLVGDYILQSQWMADHKTKRLSAAAFHATAYMVPFGFLSPSLDAWLVMAITHALIDRYRLARYVVWAKNWIGSSSDTPINRSWAECSATGYPPTVPTWLSTWLLIIADNILHILINGLCLKYL